MIMSNGTNARWNRVVALNRALINQARFQNPDVMVSPILWRTAGPGACALTGVTVAEEFTSWPQCAKPSVDSTLVY